MVISGIQQIGIGIPNVQEAFDWYKNHLGMDISVFDEAAEAGLMLKYTGGEPRSRHAILAINIQGGGGLEIWQYTSRVPQAPGFQVLLGDYGIFIAKFKSRDVARSYAILKKQGVNILNEVAENPAGKKHFYLKDPYGNLCEVVEAEDWFKSYKSHTGGVYGCTIGVSDIEKSKALYTGILGYDEIICDATDTFSDYSNLPGGDQKFRRVILKNSKKRQGAFSKLLGDSEIELVQVLDREAQPVFKDRLWGDLGFIHLCFDINGMDELRELCTSKGYPFTIDSTDSFDMGEAAGHFSYIEDPDGTLIEFVETHKVPILKKVNWYLNLRNRDPLKTLPNWMVSALAFNRKK
ncbi:MAG: catechol 2,3-dioxygenase-like lactoylglutathione lyase family enzyme [Saprospiraceae bacterium]|jgi:catechol 2,3-dioxygenase-like lactoylglutathione lyase family enzyme